MNEHLLEKNKKAYKELNIPVYHQAGITGKGVKIAVIGYGGTLEDKKPYLFNVNATGGSYHDGDEIINAVAPGAHILGINILGPGSWDFTKAMKWILTMDIDVVCASFRLSSWSAEREELSKLVWEKGTIMIASSSNEGTEGSISYPAKSKYWVCVGEYFNDGRAGSSSYGKELDCLMYSGLAVEAKENYYVPITHTSGATQIVAGMAALLKEYANVTPAGFKEFIAQNCEDLKSPGWDKETGYGLLKMPADISKIKRVYPVELTIGSKEYYVNGVKRKMDVAPYIQDKRTFVPIRFIAEGLGRKVTPVYGSKGLTEKVIIE